MKILRIVSYVFLALGVLLFLVGLFFKIQHWPDMFNGVISGTIVTVIGSVLFVISLLNRK